MKKYLNFDLTPYNSYSIKCGCAEAIFPESEDDVVNVFSNSAKRKIVIGNGNNIIFSKEWYDDTYIIFNGTFNSIFCTDNFMVADAGATLLQLSEKALEEELSGLEIFCDIPSSVGGAVVMNAGTKEGEIKDILVKVRYLDVEKSEVFEITNNDICFSYRNSFFQNDPNKIILKAWFKLHKGSYNSIFEKMNSVKLNRWKKQPREFPNCGSVFKRPKGRFVGALIDELGLKGYSIGGAKISEKHSGFIINFGGATGQDILKLISYVKTEVNNKFGIQLEVEQIIL